MVGGHWPGQAQRKRRIYGRRDEFEGGRRPRSSVSTRTVSPPAQRGVRTQPGRAAGTRDDLGLRKTGQKPGLWEEAVAGQGSSGMQQGQTLLRLQESSSAGNCTTQQQQRCSGEGIQPPTGSIPLSHLLPPPCQQRTAPTPAELQRCALAFPATQPRRDPSGASIRRDTAPTQTHPPRAPGSLGHGGAE